MKNNKDKKSKKSSKNKLGDWGLLVAVIPLTIAILLMSRCIPDGTTRLDIGKSNIGEKAIALTFDDGPGDYTEDLLDGLNEYNAEVSFFVLGKKAEKHPEIVLRAYNEGHLIGNHTYSHQNLLAVSTEKGKEEINKSAQIIKNITGEKPLFFRAPHGYVSAYQLKKFNTFFVDWSYDTYDWRNEDAEIIYNKIMENARDGSIILMHDTKKSTVEAVLRAIPELQEQGYKFVRVDDLLSRNGDKLKMGIPYKSCKHKENVVIHKD